MSQGSSTSKESGSKVLLLVADGLCKSFSSGQAQLPVVRDVSFRLAEKTTCAIVGPSGSGKTTLLGLCAGLDTPSSGRAILFGHDLADMSEEERAALRLKNVGFIFQNFQLIPTLTALENVMLPAEVLGTATARKDAMDLLAAVGLVDRAHHYPGELSGGEQQRTSIARAFINRPRILFADEPTGNLDADTSYSVVSLLYQVHKLLGTTLVLVTHNIDLAKAADQLLRMEAGRIVPDLPA